jgi:predicted CopG family antitoxin
MMIMANKTVDLNPKAYELLLKLQKKGESLSDTIIRLAAKPSIENIISQFGLLADDLDEEELEKFKAAAKEAWQ